VDCQALFGGAFNALLRTVKKLRIFGPEYIRIYVCIWAHIFVYIYAYIHMNADTCIHINMYIYMGEHLMPY
jgi:hypothetical protein